jgi:hypothetical protein
MFERLRTESGADQTDRGNEKSPGLVYAFKKSPLVAGFDL